MTYPDPRDPRQQPPTRAYTQADGYPGATDAYSQQPPAQEPPAQQPPTQGYAAPAPARSPRRGPDVDPLLYSGGVVMTGVVTALIAWLVAWIIRTVANRVTETGQLGVWNPLDNNELWFALVGFLTALVAGALWYVLQLATPTPGSFYRWIVALLIVASIVVPLAASQDIWRGVATGVLHLFIGLPILSLIPTMGNHSQRKQ